jgi:hypothetical protein
VIEAYEHTAATIEAIVSAIVIVRPKTRGPVGDKNASQGVQLPSTNQAGNAKGTWAEPGQAAGWREVKTHRSSISAKFLCGIRRPPLRPQLRKQRSSDPMLWLYSIAKSWSAKPPMKSFAKGN